MPGYKEKVLSKLKHDTLKHQQHTLFRYFVPVYGTKAQFSMQDGTPTLTAK
jgi:hypothetical protein